MKKIYLLMVVLTASVSGCSRNSSISSGSGSSLTYEETLYLHSQEWGLGETVQTYVSNDRDYDWYVDQWTTGTYWSANCGPTSIEMAGRFSDENFAYTTEDARANYRTNGGWWYDSDIHGALTQFEIPHTSSSLSSGNDLIGLLDQGGIVLVNPDMSKVSMGNEEDDHAGLYYEPGTGHYLIVKGYVLVDGATFFEVYDPWSIGESYEGGALKGKDRYYDATSLMNAILTWWPTVYLITTVAS